MAEMFQTSLSKIASATFAAAFMALMAGSVPAMADKIKHPRAVFSGLDKITGRIISFEVAIEETVQFGSLQITPRVCYTRPATEAPQTTSFIEVDEIDANSQYTRIFNGWVYAASPGLNGIEHPVYDIWLNDCKGGTDIIASAPDVPDATPDPAFADVTPKPPKPGTVPRPKRDPKIPAGPPQTSPVAVVPAPERRQPSQSFFPTTILPLGNGGLRPDPANGR